MANTIRHLIARHILRVELTSEHNGLWTVTWADGTRTGHVLGIEQAYCLMVARPGYVVCGPLRYVEALVKVASAVAVVTVLVLPLIVASR